jgi:hypothetical protein
VLVAVAGLDQPARVRAHAPSAGEGVEQRRPTFTREVAPILQRACQSCHRPQSIGPMSLVTYDEVRPWARAIRHKVIAREMPPWFIDRRVGIRRFKNDPSLTDEEIATIAGWVDAGAPRGDPADLPAARQFRDPDRWTIGEPDLVVLAPPAAAAAGANSWTDVVVDSGLKEDRYLSAVETLPGTKTQRSIHHVLTYVVSQDGSDESFLNAFVAGGNGDVFPANAGRLIAAGSKIRFNIHFHPGARLPRDDWPKLGLKFYPNGVVPRRLQITSRVGEPTEALDIPAGEANVRHDAYFKLEQASQLTSFQPHMHGRGKALCVEAILPTMRVEPINCVDRFHSGWQLAYRYADEAAPRLPAGTILHVISWHDNSSANPNNPDPRNWAGPGGRTIDEMSFAWIGYYTLTDEEFSRDATSSSSAAVAAGARLRRDE